MKMKAFYLALMVALAGCGGGGSSGGSGGGGNGGGDDAGGGGSTPSATRTGQFIDAPVAGLTYTVAPSQIACEATVAGCVTDEDGIFEYNEGDTVTFMLGAQTLGQVPAQGVVTPQTVAEAIVAGNSGASVENVRNNLLVFLQSMDDDGNPDNGISIAPAVSGAIVAANTVSFTAEPAAFDASLVTVVAGVEASTGKTLTIVDREDAIEHFVGQLANQLRGTFVGADASFAPVMQNMRTLTFFSSGTYLYGGHDGDPCDEDIGVADGADGVELGEFTYNPAAQTLTFTKSYDTNGCSGPEHDAEAQWKVGFDGTRLTITLVDLSGEPILDDEGRQDVARFVRVPTGNGNIAGSWLLPHSSLNKVPTVVSFFPAADGRSGRYFLADSRHDGSHEDYAELDAGIEEGCYTVGANSVVSFTAAPASCTAAIDTNGEDGFNGLSAPIEVDSHGRLTIIEDDGELVIRFMPLAGSPLSLNDFAGVWIMQSAPGVAPADEEGLFVLAINAGDGTEGSYVFGTQHDFPEADECSPAGYPPELGVAEDHGNGIEAGIFRLANAGGAVVPLINGSAGGVDTNGDCGLFNAFAVGEGSPNVFLFRKSKEADALLMWSNDFDEEAGFVFRRAPSVAGSVVGTWQHGTSAVRLPEMTVFLPGDQVFSMMYEPGDSGIRRELYTVAGDRVTFSSAGFDRCVDTIDYEFCDVDDSEWAIELNAERTYGTHDDGPMFKLTR